MAKYNSFDTFGNAYNGRKTPSILSDGKVVQYDGNVGIIEDDATKKRLSFCKNDLIESKDIRNDVRVLYTTVGDKASFIHKEQNESDIISLGKIWKSREEYQKAINIFEHAYRHNASLDEAKIQIQTCKTLWRENLVLEIREEYAKRDFIGILQKQQNLLNIDPEHSKTMEGVLENYPKAIKQCDEDSEKDALRHDAKKFIGLHKDFYLANTKRCRMAKDICVAVEDVEHFDEFADNLQEYYETKATLSKYCHFMQQRALMKALQGNRQKALEYFEAVKRKNPYRPNIDKYIQILLDDNSSISSFIEQASEECSGGPLSDYSRILVQTKEKKSIEDANAELKKIEQEPSAAKEERVENLLKRIQLLHIVGEDISKNLFDFYALKSRLLIAEKKLDSGRFLCREAISIFSDGMEQQNLVHALLYTASFLGIDANAIIGNIFSQEQKKDKIRKWFFETIVKLINQNTDAFDALALLSNCNNEAVNNCIFETFEKIEDKSRLFDYIGFDSVNEETETPDVIHVKKLWNERIRQEFSRFNDIKMEYMSVVHDDSLELMTKYLYTIKKDYVHPWFTENDKSLIKDFADKLPDLLNAYINESKYIPKKNRLNLIKVNLEHWNALGQDNLSDFYVSIVVPFLAKILEIVEKDFDEYSKDNKANVVLYSLNNEITVVDGVVEIQLSIKNTNDKAPFPDGIGISVESKTSCELVLKDVVDLANVNSQKSNFAIKKVFLELRESDVNCIELQFICKDNKTNDELAKGCFVFNIHPASEFSPINNKFENYASGTTIRMDSDMFYGRQQDISDFVKAISLYSNKQFLIYGQNRCGKSSTINQIIKRLGALSNVIYVKIELGSEVDSLEKYKEAAVYQLILEGLSDYAYDHSSEFKEVFNAPPLSEYAEECTRNPPQRVLKKYLRSFRDMLIMKDGETPKKIFVAIDEFSCLYSLIREKKFPESFMKQWKSLNEDPKTEFSAILVGQNVMQRFMEEPYASNAFQSIEARKMTYLDECDARDLIQKPIALPDGKSRYLGKSVEAILDFTSRNPFYIQLFCSELVKYENKRKSAYITEADVFFVAGELMKEGKLNSKDFMNLLRAGQPEPPLFSESDTMSVLTQIAVRCNELEYCPIYAISDPESGECDKESIVQHLVSCDVLEQKGNEFKIVIRLYQDWLFQNRI